MRWFLSPYEDKKQREIERLRRERERNARRYRALSEHHDRLVAESRKYETELFADGFRLSSGKPTPTKDWTWESAFFVAIESYKGEGRTTFFWPHVALVSDRVWESVQVNDNNPQGEVPEPVPDPKAAVEHLLDRIAVNTQAKTRAEENLAELARLNAWASVVRIMLGMVAATSVFVWINWKPA